MESAAVDQSSTSQTSQTTSKSSRKRNKRRREEECQEEEDTWVRDLSAIMQANQTLLEKLEEERPNTDREPFIQFVADTLRTAPKQQFDEMKELIFDIVRQGRGRQPGDSEQTSTLWARTPQAVSAPQSSTAPQSFPQPFSQHFSQSYDQPFSFQQYFHPPPSSVSFSLSKNMMNLNQLVLLVLKHNNKNITALRVRVHIYTERPEKMTVFIFPKSEVILK